jgi:hypothetical protein
MSPPETGVTIAPVARHCAYRYHRERQLLWPTRSSPVHFNRVGIILQRKKEKGAALGRPREITVGILFSLD